MQQRRWSTVTLGGLLLLAQTAVISTARAAETGFTKPNGPEASRAQSAVKTKIPAVTVIGIRERRALRRQVDRYVDATLVHHWNEPMARWGVPICPLVAGLKKRPGEFVLAHISQAARSARVPIAGGECHPNLFVVVTDSPDLLLKKLHTRDPRMYVRQDTSQDLRSYLESTRPIRVWYNISRGCGRGAPVDRLAGIGAPGSVTAPVCTRSGADMRLKYWMHRSITSALIVVDGRLLKNVTLAQLAGYIALIGLVRIQSNVNSAPAPSILSLFGHGTPPNGLTPWDRALLYAVYHTDSLLKMQKQEVENVVFRRMLRRQSRKH